MLEITGLTKRFGAHPVLGGVDLALRPGRVTAIVGPNGAGKTTLIKSVLGLTRPDGGTIRLDGVAVRAGDDRYRARIGYMPQIARFPENLSARELIAMIADLRGVGAVRELDAAATDGPHVPNVPHAPDAPDVPAVDRLDVELLERFALHPHLGKPLRALSGGTRQKVNAVLAFLFRPSLLILDEPTAGLDPVSSGILKDKVLAERAAGRTFILTSHITSELEELADDVVFLVEGRVRFAGSAEELLRRTRQTRLERAIARLMLDRADARDDAPNGAAA